jgi:imidazolonepropionase-like amidohydrolase
MIMRLSLATPALCLFLAAPLWAQSTTAITGASVVPMTRDTVLRDMTIVVRDGRIQALGPTRTTQVPAGARRIDGRGRFVLPGLADMHTHLFADGPVPDSAGAAELEVILANGVTVIRLMIGTPEHLALRKEIEAGRVMGPRLWIASPQLTGGETENAMVVRSPEEARAAVSRAAEAGYDFIKLTLDLSPEVYDAIVREAAGRRIPVVGHVDPRVGVARALAAGQHIEHLDNYMESVLADSAPSRVSVSDMGLFRAKNWETLDHVDDRKIAQIAGATARSGTFTSATLSIFKLAFGIGETDEAIQSRPDWQHMPAAWRRGYMNARQRFWSNPPTAARRARYVEVRNKLVKAIADSGGRIMAGSDSPEWLHVYGFALHRELEALVGAGLTPFQALQAATVHPAAFLGDKEWGTLEPGKRADLVLLGANPLQDIRNTTRIEAVMRNGRWLDRAALDALRRRGSSAIGGAP